VSCATAWPNSWKKVRTSWCESSDGSFPPGAGQFPTIAALGSSRVPSAWRQVASTGNAAKCWNLSWRGKRSRYAVPMSWCVVASRTVYSFTPGAHTSGDFTSVSAMPNNCW
jgi:hypothetical protein